MPYRWLGSLICVCLLLFPASRAIGQTVSGETVDQLPLDDASGIVVLQPGVTGTNLGRSVRGGLPNEEAVVINGVLTRSFGTGVSDNIGLPTNALERVAVNVGIFSAEFGEAQSGLVKYVTRSGGPALTGSFEVMSDQLGPDSWRTNFNRAELTLGGPIAGPVSFFLATTASGQDAFGTEFAPNPYTMSGFDTCDVVNFCETANGGPGLGMPAAFRLPRTSATPGLSDFVDVTAPAFVEFDNGRVLPDGWGQSDLFHGNISWQLPRDSRVNFSLTRNRDQDLGHAGFTTNFLFDGVDGARETRSSYALSWHQALKQLPDQQLSFDLLVALSRDETTSGMLNQEWWLNNRDPAFGFMAGSLDFAFDESMTTVTGFDAFHPSEDFINAYRSNAVPRDSMMLFPGRNDLSSISQSLTGLSSSLRSNPYGMRTAFPLNGAGSAGLAETAEERLQVRGALDWRVGEAHRVRAGGEHLSIDLDAFSLPLFTSGLPVPQSADPKKLGLFIQDRIDLGDIVIDAGLRYDRLDPDTEYSLVPGFVFNVPDSLKAGFVQFDGATGSYVPAFATPCNAGSATNPTGVCKDNFVPAESKSEISPRFEASYALSQTSAIRIGYGRFVQTPPFFTGLLHNANFDLQNGNTNAVFARDVDMPATRIWEVGYRVLIGDDLAINVSVFDKQQDGGLVTERQPFEDPTRVGATVFLNVLTNGGTAGSSGFEITVDKSLGNLVDSRFAYSHASPDDDFSLAPHNAVSWTTSLTLPADYREGSVLGAVLQNVGLYAILRARSGLPYTLLQNAGLGLIGPPGSRGTPGGEINGETTPWSTAFDLRLTKSFGIGPGLDLQAFVDWRNPFNIEMNELVFLETGDAVNDLFRAQELSTILRDSQLDGDNAVDDFDIRAESPDNAFNVFMLLRAEQRFGNGDGVFTVSEQGAAFGQVYENDYGVESRFQLSDQQMRLGVRIGF